MNHVEVHIAIKEFEHKKSPFSYEFIFKYMFLYIFLNIVSTTITVILKRSGMDWHMTETGYFILYNLNFLIKELA